MSECIFVVFVMSKVDYLLDFKDIASSINLFTFLLINVWKSAVENGDLYPLSHVPFLMVLFYIENVINSHSLLARDSLQNSTWE